MFVIRIQSRSIKRSVAGLAGFALLTIPLAACGSEDDAEPTTENTSTSAPANEDTAEATPAKPKPVASIPALTGETTAVALDQGFLDALETLGLTPGVLGNAELTDGSLIFPITGGNVTYFEPGTVTPYVIGQVQHENSGFSLTAGDTVVEIRNLNVDPGVSRVYGDVVVNGEVAATSAFIFNLNGSTLMPLQVEGDTAILEGTEVQISDVAAGLLNDTFQTDAVTAGLLVGIAKITVATS